MYSKQSMVIETSNHTQGITLCIMTFSYLRCHAPEELNEHEVKQPHGKRPTLYVGILSTLIWLGKLNVNQYMFVYLKCKIVDSNLRVPLARESVITDHDKFRFVKSLH